MVHSNSPSHGHKPARRYKRNYSKIIWLILLGKPSYVHQRPKRLKVALAASWNPRRPVSRCLAILQASLRRRTRRSWTIASHKQSAVRAVAASHPAAGEPPATITRPWQIPEHLQRDHSMNMVISLLLGHQAAHPLHRRPPVLASWEALGLC